MQHVTKATVRGILPAVSTTLDTDCLDIVYLCGVKKTERNVRNLVDSHIDRPWGTKSRFFNVELPVISLVKTSISFQLLQ